MLSWSIYRDAPAPGAVNMARDHALAEAAAPGRGTLRLYGWDRPTVSFGRNEPARRLWAEAGDLDFVRRPTGGRAVLHDREVTYALIVPDRTLGGPRAVYRAVNEALVAGLRALGVDARVSVRGTVLPPDAGPCFQVAAPGEVVVGGLKLVGSAQARLGGALLQHGSVLVAGDQGPGSTTLEAEIEEPVDPCDVRVALERGFRRVLGGRWDRGQWDAAAARRAARLRTDRYESDDWTWRR